MLPKRIFQMALVFLTAWTVTTSYARPRARPYANTGDDEVERLAADLDSEAIAELGKRKRVNAKAVLEEIADSTDVPKRLREKHSGEDKSSEEFMQRYLKPKHSNARRSARIALAQMGDKQRIREFVAALSSKNERERWEAIRALGEIGDKRAVKYLGPILLDDSTPSFGTRHEPAPAWSAVAQEALAKILPDVKEGFKKQNPGRRFFFDKEWKAWWKANKGDYQEGVE